MLAVLFVLDVSAVHAAGSNDLVLTLRVPDRVTDSLTIKGIVALENRSTRSREVTGVDSPMLRFYVWPIEDAGTGKCSLTTIPSSLVNGASRVRLAPGQRLQAEANVVRNYPLGVPPGKYRVQAAYAPDGETIVESNIVEFVVEPLTSTAYRGFLEVCSALREHQPDAITRLLAFARENASFEFTAPLVESVLWELRGETGIEAADFLIHTYPGTMQADSAKRAKELYVRTDRELRDYDAYMLSLREAASRPENASVVRDVQRLGSIVKPADFASYEEFLRRHPDSYFDAEARRAMITAVEEGIVPPGQTREAALSRLYNELVERDPGSYWARKAMRDPAVAAFLKKGERR